MDFVTSIIIAGGLAMDAFAVSLGVGTTDYSTDQRAGFRLAFHFGLFQTLMTVIGWLIGSSIANLISSWDHWIAMALLGYVGGKMIQGGLDPQCESYTVNPSRGRTLIMLCVATSIDALAVGLSMAMLNTSVWIPSLIIGIVTAGLSAFGFLTGAKLGGKFGKRMELLGGILLVGIGIRVVVTHLF